MRTRHALAALTVAVASVAGVVGVKVADASGQGTAQHQQFVGIQTSPAEDAPLTVYAVGPITGVASDTVLSDTRDEFAFADGSITIDHVARHSEDHLDTSTCQFQFGETGTYRIVGGTGAYEDARGHGNYTVRAVANDACDENTPPSTLVVIIDADGLVTL